ncbi:MAG: hypothetical protein RO257_12060 [Candidatus Kapabacteria bacterium]|jgi:hypothetical protein|nr:hypothetical protein [Candidatus Kapabacteria bacterium]
MKGKLKNIIVLILLVIFPISAIGLNVSVHKCKLKGSIYFNFFGTTNDNNELICGCKAKETQTLPIQKAHSCCNQANIVNESADCNETENTGNQLLKSSCCSDSDLSYSIQNDFISFNKSNILTDKTFVFNILNSNERCNAFRTSAYLVTVPDYPLQELICNTISFIHFSSQSKNNSEEPPIHKC